MRYKKLSLAVGIALVLLLTVSPVLAQGGAIGYGDNVMGSLSVSAPLVFYSFSGAAGDLVTVQVIAITPGLAPTVSLLGPAQQMLASSQADPFGLGDGEVRLSFRLVDSGAHSLLVSSAAAAPGDFLLRLRGAAPAASAGVNPGASAVMEVLPGGGPQLFSISANPDAALPVSISTLTPEFGFAVQVRDPQGGLLSVLAGSDAAPVTLLLPPGQGVYELAVLAQAAKSAGAVAVTVGTPLSLENAGLGSQPGDLTAGGTATPVPVDGNPNDVGNSNDVGDSNDVGAICRISSPANVNMRLAPSLTGAVVGTLVANSEQSAAGVSEDGQWFALNIGGQVVWVAADVVSTNGPCNQLPVVQPGQQLPSATPTATVTTDPGVTATATATATVQGVVQVTPTSTASATQPAQQQVQATATYTPSYTPTATVFQPTSTYTPSYTPTATVVQPTATYTPSYTPTTPPPVPTAPPDANFNNPLNIPLDSTVSTTDFVSYPGGDTQDRVRWDISGMNPNASLSGGRARLIIAVSCFGTGTNQVQFFTGGQAYNCGQTIVDREVTADSRTGQVTITAVGGENTYVQWVLTGTATRMN